MLPFCSNGINFINENYRWRMLFCYSKHFPDQLWTISLKTWKDWHALDLLLIVKIICRQDLTTASTFKAIHIAYVRHSEWFIWGFRSVGWGLARIVFLMKNHCFEMSLFISWHTVTEHKLHKVINTFRGHKQHKLLLFLPNIFVSILIQQHEEMLQLFGLQLLSLTEFFLQKVTDYPLKSIYTGVVTENCCIFLLFTS